MCIIDLLDSRPDIYIASNAAHQEAFSTHNDRIGLYLRSGNILFARHMKLQDMPVLLVYGPRVRDDVADGRFRNVSSTRISSPAGPLRLTSRTKRLGVFANNDNGTSSAAAAASHTRSFIS